MDEILASGRGMSEDEIAEAVKLMEITPEEDRVKAIFNFMHGNRELIDAVYVSDMYEKNALAGELMFAYNLEAYKPGSIMKAIKGLFSRLSPGKD